MHSIERFHDETESDLDAEALDIGERGSVYRPLMIESICKDRVVAKVHLAFVLIDHL